MSGSVKTRKSVNVSQGDKRTWEATYGKRSFKINMVGSRITGMSVYSLYRIMEGDMFIGSFAKKRKKDPIELIIFSIETVCS